VLEHRAWLVARVSGVIAAAIGLLLPLHAQDKDKPDVPRFRVGVDAVRIDAVVTDRDGRIVTDLTAADFDVKQDGKRQAVTFAQFMPIQGADAVAEPAPSAGRRESTPPAGPPAVVPAAPLLKREDVQRTFALVIDDLGLSVESLQNARRALHAFVDRDLRPTDLAAVVRTGGSAGALQPFTTDHRVLHAAIDALRWNGASRSGVEPFTPVNIYAASDEHSDLADPTDFKLVDQIRGSMLAGGTLGALNLVVRGARDLPGRKAIVFVSEGFQMMTPELTGPASGNKEPNARVRLALDAVVDQATRAGVVIYSLDCRGLQSAGLQAADNIKFAGTDPGQMEALVRSKALERLEFNRDTQEGMAYLAEQTGGFAVLNNNDLANGLGRITNDVRGYYVVGYVPRDGTFARPGQKPQSHKISIDVNRPGLRVKTRKAFVGVSDPPDSAAPETPAQQLVHAATSPFAATDIALHATTLPGYSRAQGMFVRTLLHIDARALTFVDGEGGKHTAAADVLGMVFDQEGTEVAHLSTGFAVALTADGAADALREGLAYTLRIPIRRSGAYQVRFAVRDQKSGAMGSAGEFVQMADIAGGTFALSGIALRPDEGSVAKASGMDLLTPAQAIGSYPAGSRLSYAYEIYNASESVRAAMSVWRGAERIFAAPPDTLVRPAGADLPFAAAGSFRVGGLAPGSYILQIAAVTSDPAHVGRSRTAVQQIAFDVQ
jgi:VWFA-related protein